MLELDAFILFKLVVLLKTKTLLLKIVGNNLSLSVRLSFVS